MDNKNKSEESTIDVNAQIDLMASGNSPVGLGPIGRKAEKIKGIGKYGPVVFIIILLMFVVWVFLFWSNG